MLSVILSISYHTEIFSRVYFYYQDDKEFFFFKLCYLGVKLSEWNDDVGGNLIPHLHFTAIQTLAPNGVTSTTWQCSYDEYFGFIFVYWEEVPKHYPYFLCQWYHLFHPLKVAKNLRKKPIYYFISIVNGWIVVSIDQINMPEHKNAILYAGSKSVPSRAKRICPG